MLNKPLGVSVWGTHEAGGLTRARAEVWQLDPRQEVGNSFKWLSLNNHSYHLLSSFDMSILFPLILHNSLRNALWASFHRRNNKRFSGMKYLPKANQVVNGRLGFEFLSVCLLPSPLRFILIVLWFSSHGLLPVWSEGRGGGLYSLGSENCKRSSVKISRT